MNDFLTALWALCHSPLAWFFAGMIVLYWGVTLFLWLTGEHDA